mgnify:CR=1 FL=1
MRFGYGAGCGGNSMFLVVIVVVVLFGGTREQVRRRNQMRRWTVFDFGGIIVIAIGLRILAYTCHATFLEGLAAQETIKPKGLVFQMIFQMLQNFQQ